MGEKIIPFEPYLSPEEKLAAAQALDMLFEKITAREHHIAEINSPTEAFELPLTTIITAGTDWLEIRRSYDGKRRRVWHVTHRDNTVLSATDIVLSAAPDQYYIGIHPDQSSAPYQFCEITKLELSDFTEIAEQASEISEHPRPAPINVLPFIRPAK